MASLESASTVSLFFFIIINPFVIWWQAYYVICTIDPLYNQSKATNQYRYSLQTEFIGFVGCGFALILLNSIALICTTLLLLRYKYMAVIPWTIRYCLIVPIMAAIGVVITFGPFISPFISADLAWRSKYRDTCYDMDVRVYLDSAKTRHSPLVEFFNLSSGENYAMNMVPDPQILGLDRTGIYTLSLVQSEGMIRKDNSTFVPTWDHVSFNLNDNIYTVLDSSNKSIKSGEFSLGEDFKIPGFGVTGNLEHFAKRCVFDPTVEIYDLGVNFNGQRVLKSVVMKTAQFKICDRLQVCSGDWFGNMTAVPVGLLMLQRAGRPSRCCTGILLPGVAGRDRGVDGNG